MIVPKSDVVTVQGDCDERVSDVSVRVVAFQTSLARDAIEVSVLELYAQTCDGRANIEAAREVEAFEVS